MSFFIKCSYKVIATAENYICAQYTQMTAYLLFSRAVKLAGGGGGVQCVATGVFTGTQRDVVMQLASSGDNVVQSPLPHPPVLRIIRGCVWCCLHALSVHYACSVRVSFAL